jgi:hypothetical protein
VTNEISAMRYFDPIDVKHLKRAAKTFSELKQLKRKFEAVEIEKELWVLENQGLSSYIYNLAKMGIKAKHNDSQLWTAHILEIT